MKRISARVLLMLLACWVAVCAFAQDTTYRLQPEDFIRIQVYNEQQILADVTVGKDGNISAPFVGIIRAEGKTTAELERDLAVLYEQKLRLRNPIVSVIILRFREMRATILGPVSRPGTFPFRQGDTILTLVGLGGGVNEANADMKRATLRRNGTSELIPIDLESMLHRGDTSQNFELRDGDELIIPVGRRNRSIQVLGMVQRPGLFGYVEGMRLGDAIALSGGEIPRQTKYSGTTVIRERPGMPGQFMYIRADWVRFIKKQDSSQNILLEGGDIVYIPNTGTPNLGELSNALNAAFFADRVLFRDGLFGFRPLSFLGG